MKKVIDNVNPEIKNTTNFDQYVLDSSTLALNFKPSLTDDIQNQISLNFLSTNNKLFKIIALPEYKGKVWGKIGIGMTEEELLEAEPSFVYDDFEEVWISDKGIFIEMNPITNTVMWISVYIPELLTDDFDKGNW